MEPGTRATPGRGIDRATPGVRARLRLTGRRVLRRWTAWTLIGLLLFTGTAIVVSTVAAQPRTQPAVQPGPLIVVGMPGLTWSEVSARRMPALWSLARRGAVAAQTTMSLRVHTCSDGSWLTLSSGERTTTSPSAWRGHRSGPRRCPPPLVPEQRADGSAVFEDWAGWRRFALTRSYPADLGMLAGSMAAAGQCIAAAGPAAALGAANRGGVVAHYSRDPDAVDLSACPVTLIGLAGPDDVYLARLLARAPRSSTVVVSGIADGGGPETLHPLVVAGPGVRHGLLTSSSTRQPGFVQTTDLTALVLSRLPGDGPTLREGRAPTVLPDRSPTEPMSDAAELTHALGVESAFVPRFFALFLGGGGLAVLLGLAGWWWARRRRDAGGRSGERSRLLRWWFAIVGSMCGAMPAATFLVGLVPWWRASAPQVVLPLGIIGISAVLTLLALLGPWRRSATGPAAFLAATTAFVIAQDVIHGSRLQFISLIGLQPASGARYYGQGNVAFGVFATCTLLLAALLAGPLVRAGERRLAAVTVALLGLAAVAVDGYPAWGADDGGPVALIASFGFLVLAAQGLGMTWRRLGAILVAVVLVVGGFALRDYLSPAADRTHLGDFVAHVGQTGRPTGLVRILTENWDMLTSSWLDLAVVPLLLLTLLFLVRPALLARPLAPVLGRIDFLGSGLAAVGVCWLIGFLVNDSGTAIPPAGLLALAPLLILLAARLPPRGSVESAVGEPRPTPTRGDRRCVSAMSADGPAATERLGCPKASLVRSEHLR